MTITPNKVPYTIPQPNNMGIVRYVLALGVLIAHFKWLTGYEFWFPISSYSCVGGFFALSGFLIYGSYARRRSWREFILSRARRLLPAYWLTVLIFAVGLAGLSDFSCGEYFGSGTFWKYLISNLAFLNFIEPTLPGVFDGGAVNGSLWTMKVEWALYLSVPIVFWFATKLKRYSSSTFIGIYLISIAYRLFFIHLYDETGHEIYLILERQFLGQMSYFYLGVLGYYYFDFFMSRKWIFLTAAILMAAVSPLLSESVYNIIVHPVEMSILVIFFSMVGRFHLKSWKKDNLSYNIYLLHYPVIQTLIALGVTTDFPMWVSLSASIAGTIALSYVVNIFENMIRRQLTKQKKSIR